MNIPTAFPKKLNKRRLYEIAEWAVASLVLAFGVKHIRQIVAFVLLELYKYLIQKNMLPAS